jgi:hypothetical protein
MTAAEFSVNRPSTVALCWAGTFVHSTMRNNKTNAIFILAPFLPIAEWLNPQQTRKVPGSIKYRMENIECGICAIRYSLFKIRHLMSQLRGQRWLRTKLPLHRLSTKEGFATNDTNYTNELIRAIRVIRG